MADFPGKASSPTPHDAEQTLPPAFDELQDDHAEEDVWVDRSWRQPPPAQPETPELAELLEGLERQRIGVQDRYTALKLKPGIHSPQTRAEWLRGASDAFTATILVLTVAIGVTLFPRLGGATALALGDAGRGRSSDGGSRRPAGLTEGLLLRTEAERYRWYLASVRSIARRFERAKTPDRILLLRELERLAYQEMRRFCCYLRKVAVHHVRLRLSRCSGFRQTRGVITVRRWPSAIGSNRYFRSEL